MGTIALYSYLFLKSDFNFYSVYVCNYLFQVSKYLKERVKEIGVNYDIRVIQTAYANGKSTSYIENTLVIYLDL